MSRDRDSLRAVRGAGQELVCTGPAWPAAAGTPDPARHGQRGQLPGSPSLPPSHTLLLSPPLAQAGQTQCTKAYTHSRSNSASCGARHEDLQLEDDEGHDDGDPEQYTSWFSQLCGATRMQLMCSRASNASTRRLLKRCMHAHTLHSDCHLIKHLPLALNHWTRTQRVHALNRRTQQKNPSPKQSLTNAQQTLNKHSKDARSTDTQQTNATEQLNRRAQQTLSTR
jgi:hypothetical protein